MKINDYIKIDNDQVFNNKEFKLFYSGYLTEVSEDEPILLRYGNEDWKNTKTVEMKKDENNNLYADIKLNNFNKMNFCFTYNNVWDNNFSNDYSIEVTRFNMDNYEEENEELEDHFTDDFLLAYNLNKKEKDIREVLPLTKESEIYENALNIASPDTELQNLRESLDKLFPESVKSKKEIERFEETLAARFADSFVSSELYQDDDFIEIELGDEELEVYTPKIAYRQTLLSVVAAREYEEQFTSNIVLEDEKVILKSKTQYIHKLREITRKEELAQILRLSTEDDAKFLVVSPYSELDIYDDSIVGTIKRYVAYISRSTRKIYHYLRENFGTDEV